MTPLLKGLFHQKAGNKRATESSPAGLRAGRTDS